VDRRKDMDEREKGTKILISKLEGKRSLFIFKPSFGGMVSDVEHVGFDNMGRF
jgi:hypothetical protein